MSVISCRVAGVTYRARESLGCVRMAAEVPMVWRLVPEPNNRFDGAAVRVEARPEAAPDDGWFQVGYVPRSHSATVAGLLAAGRVAGVGLVGHGTLKDRDDIPWLRIAIQLTDEGGSR